MTIGRRTLHVHPDGFVYIRGEEGMYAATDDLLAADLVTLAAAISWPLTYPHGDPPPPEYWYDPGRKFSCRVDDGQRQIVHQPPEWADGDALLALYLPLWGLQEQRRIDAEEAAGTPPEPPPHAEEPEDTVSTVLLNLERRADARVDRPRRLRREYRRLLRDGEPVPADLQEWYDAAVDAGRIRPVNENGNGRA